MLRVSFGSAVHDSDNSLLGMQHARLRQASNGRGPRSSDTVDLTERVPLTVYANQGPRSTSPEAIKTAPQNQ